MLDFDRPRTELLAPIHGDDAPSLGEYSFATKDGNRLLARFAIFRGDRWACVASHQADAAEFEIVEGGCIGLWSWAGASGKKR